MKFKDITQKELDALIKRVEEALENDLALCADDLRLLLSAIQTLATLQGKMDDDGMTLLKLKKLLGMVASSEKKRRGKGSRQNKKSTTKRNKLKKSDLPTETHTLTEHKKGDTCPQCPTETKGKLYKFQPLEFVRVTAHAPFEGKKHVVERLRCNLCNAIFTATVPDSVLEDGPVTQKYGYTARSAMAMDKFFSGQGYHHQEILSQFSGLSITASTIYDQVEALSDMVNPVYKHLLQMAAQAEQFLLDDTSHKILNQEPEKRPNSNGKGERLRTGIYSSGVIARTKDQKELVVFETSLGHAGELMRSLLDQRDPSLPKPKVMSDALSSNSAYIDDANIGYCNSHARRNFAYLENKFPEEFEQVLEMYAPIWRNEHHIIEQGLNAQKRLEYHQKHSLPVMTSLKKWCVAKQTASDFEEHSGLGKAIAYFLRHYDKLIAFCVFEGMPIDNNRMEETLKLVIRGRKSYMFFKTVSGATVGNICMTMIMTTYRANVNPLDYLTALQRHHTDMRENPELWMPWNYKKRIESLRS